MKQTIWKCDSCQKVNDINNSIPNGWIEARMAHMETKYMTRWYVWCSYRCLAEWAKSHSDKFESELVEKIVEIVNHEKIKD